MYSIEIINEYMAGKEAVSEKSPSLVHSLSARSRIFRRVPNVWSSNAIEGNTLAEDETALILRDGATAGQYTYQYRE